jgi:hypothetical protein
MEAKDMKTVKVTVKLEKPFHDAIQEYLKKYPYYEGIEDFILEATRKHMQNLAPLLRTAKS